MGKPSPSPRTSDNHRWPATVRVAREPGVRGVLSRLAWRVWIGLFLCAAPAAAQELPLKRDLPAIPAPGCGPAAVGVEITPDRRAEAARLADRGRQAALLGDNEEAVALLQRAAELDPADADVAYRLGRAREEGSQTAEAVGAYCRYLALAPAGDDAGDVRARLAALPPSPEGARAERAATRFRAGLAAYGRGELVAAEQAFDEALREAPQLAAAFYDRAVVRAARNNAGGAAKDLQRYLELQPAAPDRGAVRDRIAALGAPPAPRVAAARPVPQQGGEVLAGALVVPGLGQFLTGRPGLGALVLGGAAAAAFVALQPQDVTVVREYPLPFGEGTYTDTTVEQQRTRLVPGLAAAAVITAAGALEAYLHARRARSAVAAAAGASSPVGLVLWPEPGGVRFAVEARLGS